ncbi:MULTISPECIES: phage minor capsid protein [Bacillales]|uniref:phage minor capsid protein n=1 Tax=Bacillales TaxID=1385 RepID=UPI000BEB6CBB|nr:phage minor capsid protein [Bacillus cereus]PED33910.1 minor capsid protein [Bacillus cereus]PEE52069.1 minor capsid protein [Bacillus cereus]PFL90915.1 minor capsid protein [Bacillus cereus]PFV69454.1 minor capsid protein [Bacillus cereus]PGS34980.1 minor capsid protein [Bacillus cereus]
MNILPIEGRAVPQPSYDYKVRRLVRLYKKALKEIQKELGRTDVTRLSHANSYALMRSIQARLIDLDKEAVKWISENIPAATKQGTASALISLGYVDTIEEAMLIAKFNQTNRLLVASAVADTQKDVLAITQNMNAQIQKKIQKITLTVISEQLTLGYGMRTIRNEMRERIKKLQEELKDAADTAIIDSAGRRWKVEHYTEMLARTKLTLIHTEATRNEALGRDALYATISVNTKTWDACKYHQGRIIKLDPNAKGNYPTYEELKMSGQIFHPNCKHHIQPFRMLSRLDEEARQFAENQHELGTRAIEAGGRNPNEDYINKK